MPKQQHRSRTEVINEIAEQPHHIVVARQAAGRRAAHPRQIWIDPPVACCGNDSLDRRLNLSVIDTSAVQRNKRHAVVVLDVMHRDIVESQLHIDTVMIGADKAGGNQSRPGCGSLSGRRPKQSNR